MFQYISVEAASTIVLCFTLCRCCGWFL